MADITDPFFNDDRHRSDYSLREKALHPNFCCLPNSLRWEATTGTFSKHMIRRAREERYPSVSHYVPLERESFRIAHKGSRLRELRHRFSLHVTPGPRTRRAVGQENITRRGRHESSVL